ncbi:MAG: hypothetical protein LC796_07325 [Acidobacteria bacterium]|nr:hypothetical protein [Acidobacteriota bacterium]MCA1612534.1 hypothetical protein [Acidobacteriota bacterium]
MRVKTVVLGVVLLGGVFPGSALAVSRIASVAVTGSPTPAATGVPLNLFDNTIAEFLNVLPVVESVTGAVPSMAASVSVSPASLFSLCGVSLPGCASDFYLAQWTISSDASGIRAQPAFQGSGPLRLLNNTGAPQLYTLRCQTAQVSGSCIFSFRYVPVADPLF